MDYLACLVLFVFGRLDARQLVNACKFGLAKQRLAFCSAVYLGIMPCVVGSFRHSFNLVTNIHSPNTTCINTSQMSMFCKDLIDKLYKNSYDGSGAIGEANYMFHVQEAKFMLYPINDTRIKVPGLRYSNTPVFIENRNLNSLPQGGRGCCIIYKEFPTTLFGKSIIEPSVGILR